MRAQADPVTSARTLLENLPAYKLSLESRYPVLCRTCSPKVSELIKTRDYKVKAFSLNESVKRLTQPLQSPITSVNPLGSNGCGTLPIRGMGGKLWTIQEWLWRLQGFMWLSGYVASISAATYAALSFECGPVPAQPDSSRTTRFPVIFSYCSFELLCSFFDLTWSKVRRNRAQGIRTKVLGKHLFLCMNTIACVLRLLIWGYFFDQEANQVMTLILCTVSPLWGTFVLVCISGSLLMLLIFSLSTLKTNSPVGVKSLPNSRIRSLAQATPKPTYALPEHEVFSTLSLAREASSFPNSKSISHIASSGDTESNSSHFGPEHEFGKSKLLQSTLKNFRSTDPLIQTTSQEPDEVPMDWEPSSVCDPSDTLQLRPQTFLPPPLFREETGIEELFRDKVRLATADTDREKTTSWFGDYVRLMKRKSPSQEAKK